MLTHNLLQKETMDIPPSHPEDNVAGWRCSCRKDYLLYVEMNNLDRLLQLACPVTLPPPYQEIVKPIKESGYIWSQDGTLIRHSIELDSWLSSAMGV